MILLTTSELVAAVRRSLEQHVVPAVADEFPRVQVAAAVVALGEVLSRLEGDDAIVAEEARLHDTLARLAGAWRAEVGRAADSTRDALAAAVAPADPRDRVRHLREALYQLTVDEDPRVSAAAVQAASEISAAAAAADAAWVCAEAVASLQ